MGKRLAKLPRRVILEGGGSVVSRESEGKDPLCGRWFLVGEGRTLRRRWQRRRGHRGQLDYEFEYTPEGGAVKDGDELES